MLWGNPGVGKSHLLDALALTIAGNKHAVEHVNGQSMSVETVRAWRRDAAYGNLFSPWTVKRVDEIDLASPAAVAELLTLLDYMPERFAVLATTNEYGKLRSVSKGRLETRFKVFPVDAPSVEECAVYLATELGVDAAIAAQIATGAVPFGCLPTEGVNMRAAIEDAGSYAAVIETRQAVAA